MALASRCRGGTGDSISEEFSEEDLLLSGSAFEPLSDSCGESDMEGLDLSLFEPQAESNSWCDSRVHAGTLYLLVDYCGKPPNNKLTNVSCLQFQSPTELIFLRAFDT